MFVVKVPALNGLGKTDGCETAPNAIIKATKEDEWLSEAGKPKSFKLASIVVDKSDIEQTNRSILSAAKKAFAKDFTLFLGGDHSISYSLINAFKSSFSNSGLIVLDAHADCIHNFKPPTHEDWLRVAIEEGFPASNVLLVGLRSLHGLEKEFLQKRSINVFSMRELAEDLAGSCDAIMEAARAFDSLYLSVDVDVVDPAFAPGTGYCEPGGLSSRQLLYLLQRFKLLKNLKAADIVEVNPTKDERSLTTKLAAKLVAELV